MVDPVYEAITDPSSCTFNCPAAYTTTTEAYEAITEANPAYAAATETNLASNPAYAAATEVNPAYAATTEVNPAYAAASKTVKSFRHEYEDVKLHSNSKVGILHHDAYQFTACCAYGKTVN